MTSLLVVACNSTPTQTDTALEILIASGDGQYGTVGEILPTPLQALVRAAATSLPREGVTVQWTVLSGDASIVGVSGTLTDSTGIATTQVQLGSSTGAVVVEASVTGAGTSSVEYELFTVDPPTVVSLEPTDAVPGTPITITGSNFSPVADQNVVLFSGVRGRIVSASSTELVVTVPACLPQRSVDVAVQLGPVGSSTLSLSVSSGGDVEALGVGEYFDAFDAPGYLCANLPATDGARYLVAVHSAGQVGAATHPYVVTGLASAPPVIAAVSASDRLSFPARVATSPSPTAADRWESFSGQGLAAAEGEPQALLDGYLRERESRLIRERSAPSVAIGEAPSARAPALATVPTVGDRRTFSVFRNSGTFAEVTAVARWVGDRAALFVDEDAPTGGYTDADLEWFSDHFDGRIHPSVTGTFGAQSDLDDNGRIVILFTPAVNALTPRGASGFIGGFFYGLDLLPESENSNAGEIFYAVVPDPSGVHSDPRPKDALRALTPAVLAHEFQHMVNFNQRVLLRDAASNEAVWLSEGLAQYAEELTARTSEAGGAEAATIELFRAGIRSRSRNYLNETDSVSLIISAGSGNLPERGAGFLFVMYLADRFGDDIARRLSQTIRTGVSNVEVETGTDWAELLSDWWAALYLDGPGPEAGPQVYPTVDLRGFLGDPFPLDPMEIGGGDFTMTGTLRSAAVAYYIVDPATGGSTTLRIGGEGGGGSSMQAVMRMRIIRIE